MQKREFYLKKIENGFKQTSIVVLIGARQVGKTSLMKTFVAGKKTVFLNGQDAEIAALFQKLSLIEQYLKVYLNEELNGFLLVDEFQYINGVSTMLKLLVDKHEKLKILCTGSSSLDILQKVEESLAGRVRIVEVLSLSFAEYLQFYDEKLYALFQAFDANTESSALTLPIEQLFAEYLIYGGFPRAALAKSKEDKAEILNDIYQTYLMHDVRNYVKNEHSVGFNKLLRLLSAQIGNLVNVNELSRECGLPYKVCEEYLYLLEQMYIIKLIEPYFVNKRKVIGKMKKVYFCDLGLRNLIEQNFNELAFRADNGAVFENGILLSLWRNKGVGGSLQFYRTTDGAEVDFVLSMLTTKAAVECKCKTLDKPISVQALNRFCEEENIAHKFIVNLNLNTVHNGAKLIQGFLTDKM
ncbi:MAG: ATP-binding protein [Prevotellaceae bacterium]|jgi:predicted AAA+ superfamily ATPase|nr:ATP-binding protein [Prevotellaceae bacterium]